MQVDETVDELTNRVDESEEKAQMDDLISRQEAIRTFMGKVHDDYPILSDAMIGILEQLPTVNPQEPCDVSDTNVGKIDAVSRHAAIEKIHWLGIDNDTAIMCDLAIRALPSVKPKQRWIPVGEELPQKGYSVLVTRITDDNCKYVRIASYQGDCWMDDTDEFKKPNPHKVIAWQPFPKSYEPHPYKGWSDGCELCGHCMDDDQEDDWIYDGNGRPKNCPLMEIDRQAESEEQE